MTPTVTSGPASPAGGERAGGASPGVALAAPHRDGGATPYQDGGATPHRDGGATPYQDGGATPSQDGGATPYQDGGAMPSQDDGATPYRVAARRLLRDSLFDATRALLGDRPWAQITMSDVARTAGVSRQTLYTQFGSRDEFAQQFVIREGARFLDAVERAILGHLDDPVAAMAAGMEVFLTLAPQDPLVGMLLDDDGTGGMLPLLTTRSRPVLEWASERLCQAMRTGWPGVGDGDAKLLAESFVRLAISYVTTPTDSPRHNAEAAARLIGPYVERAMATE